MSDVAIKFENVSKLYELGTVGTGTLSHDLKRWWITSVLHKDDPYLKIGETNDRSTKGDSKFVYALKDIDFEVKQGDVLGIIGKNGAGKSTLLKLLSRVTAPTTGKIYTKGRIASLLEVGTGFHPELTGRENIYMNGTILGMKKWEIDKQLEEIVDFSGCERYLDTPVKRYSSGMTVRLGFAIAAHLNPEILVVDEVLAVGDAEFQKKAIGKMQDVSKGEGRSVLFVSHNMASVKQLCNNCIVLKNGVVDMMGGVTDCVNRYLSENIIQYNIGKKQIDNSDRKYECSKELEFLEVSMLNDVNEMSNEEPIELSVVFKRNVDRIKYCQIGIAIENTRGEEIGINYSESFSLPDKSSNIYIARIVFPNHSLAKGRYSLVFSLCDNDKMSRERTYDVVCNVISFEVNYIDKNHSKVFVSWPKSCSISYYPVKVQIS